MLKIGHRGAKGYVAENTLASFQKAMDLGCDGVELDVHLSADNEIMVIHDDTIDRTTLEKGFVNTIATTKLQQLGVPTLSEVLDLVNKRCLVNIEIKDTKATDFVVKLIQNYISENNWNYSDFIISSFDWSVLESIHSTNSQIALGVLTENTLEEALIFAQKINAYSIHPYYQLLTKEKVTLYQDNGFLLFPWTVNETHEIEKLKTFTVNGIISDFPDRL
jgi:glycerophosphoryl diester phosphodiesterase